MRVVILGAGGIGGVIGGRLHQSFYKVVLIARGEHLRAIQQNGLRLEDPDESVTLNVPAVGSPTEVNFDASDVVIIATKTQDSAVALQQLRESTAADITVACATNGVEAERLALRLFDKVLGINVMMPTAFLEPGVVQVISAPIGGSLDVGVFPTGTSEAAYELAGMLSASQFVSEARPYVMRAKYRKLIMNTANAVETACGRQSEAAKQLIALAAKEAEIVFAASRIDVATEDEEGSKRATMVYRPINGKHRGGGSTWQSVVSGRSIETDYLNGEVVLQGRLAGVPTPVNLALVQVMNDLVRSRTEPGTVDAATVLQQLRRQQSKP
jgi:2-dehydropantoate 2-reductase